MGSWPALNAVTSGPSPISNTISSVTPRLASPFEAIAHQSESLKQLTTVWLKAHPINGNLLRSTSQLGVFAQPKPPAPSQQTHLLMGRQGPFSCIPTAPIRSTRPTRCSTLCCPRLQNLLNHFSHSFLEIASKTEICTEAFPFTQKEKCS